MVARQTQGDEITKETHDIVDKLETVQLNFLYFQLSESFESYVFK